MTISLGLSYDDVLLIPQKTGVSSRSLIDTSSFLSKRVRLNIPIVSANMDTVTESQMAITMAMAGGAGIIHRFLTIEEQAAKVDQVKHYDGFILDEPRTLFVNDTLEKVYELIDRYGTTGFVVIDEKRKVVGILSKRDYLFEKNFKTTVGKLMTTREKLITSGPKTSREKASELFRKYKIEKLPILDAKDRLLGEITVKALLNEQKYPLSCRDKRGRLIVGAAVGVKEHDKDRARELVRAGVDVLVIDIAHGHSQSVLEMTKYLKKTFSVDVVAGNVATPAGVADLAKAGADGIKVGIGAGAVCITRIVAGSGYPQFSAVMECAAEAKKWKLPIIADQSIRAGGDIAKAMGAGAGCVMVGTLLAGTDEAPGNIVTKNGKKYKVTRGMASLGANAARRVKDNPLDEKVLEELKEYVAEGVEALVPYRGKAEEVLNQLVGGLRSGMSYTGANNILEMKKKARFVQITSAGVKESGAHDVEVI